METSITIEREVKFLLTSREDGERRLTAVGAELVKPRHFEENRLFDFDQNPLAERGKTIRLRRAGGEAWLTFKGPLRQGFGGQGPTLGPARIKERLEIETALESADAMTEILLELGLSETFRYEKYRACYRSEDLFITLDETPIGDYVEIEGAPDAIEEMAGRLGFSMDASIGLSYPRLYQIRRQESPELPADMTFREAVSGR